MCNCYITRFIKYKYLCRNTIVYLFFKTYLTLYDDFLLLIIFDYVIGVIHHLCLGPDFKYVS